MWGKGFRAFAVLGVIMAGLWSWPGQAQMERRPGSFFIGDTDGDGIVGPRDVFGLQFKIIRPSIEFPEVVPSNGDNLDLDGDGAIGPGDFIVIQNWVLGNFASFPGRPQHVIPELKSYVITGISDQDSVEIYAQVFAGSTARPLSGWGVVFTVDANAPYCSAVRLLGRRVDPQPEQGRDQYAIGPEVFEYTGAGSAGGKAKVKLLIDNCPRLSQINILVRLPSDDESHNPPGRLPDPLDGENSIKPTVHVGGAWVELCGGGVCSATGNGVLTTGKPLVAESADGILHVVARTLYRYWNGSSWSGVISVPFTTEAMAINPTNHKPVIAAVVNKEIYVTCWNGSSWQGLGGSAAGGGVSNTPTQDSYYPSLAIGPDGMPAVAWRETVGGDTTEVYLRKWNGSSWAELAGSGSGNGISNSLWGAETPSLVSDSENHPVIAWIQKIYNPASGGAPGFVYLKKWDGSAWVELAGSGSGTGVKDCRNFQGLGHCDDSRVVLQSNNNPIISYTYWVDGYHVSWPAIKSWNGASWDSISVGYPGPVCHLNPSFPYFSNYAFALDALNRPMFAHDNNQEYQPFETPIWMERYEGTEWEDVDGSCYEGIFSCSIQSGNATPNLSNYQGHPVIAWGTYGDPTMGCSETIGGTYLKVYVTR